MKKQLDYGWLTVLAMLLGFMMCSCKSNPNYNPYAPVGPGTHHQCIDSTHYICDGNCECDGMGCVYATNGRYTTQVVPLRDYQIEIGEDSLLVFDGKRHVGTIAHHWEIGVTPIDSLIMADNE